MVRLFLRCSSIVFYAPLLKYRNEMCILVKMPVGKNKVEKTMAELFGNNSTVNVYGISDVFFLHLWKMVLVFSKFRHTTIEIILQTFELIVSWKPIYERAHIGINISMILIRSKSRYLYVIKGS